MYDAAVPVSTQRFVQEGARALPRSLKAVSLNTSFSDLLINGASPPWCQTAFFEFHVSHDAGCADHMAALNAFYGRCGVRSRHSWSQYATVKHRRQKVEIARFRPLDLFSVKAPKWASNSHCSSSHFIQIIIRIHKSYSKEYSSSSSKSSTVNPH
jgi:hypothetical protein